jgi:hypothetical protein
MTEATTVITREDADNAYLVKVTVEQLDLYIDGSEMNEIIEDFDHIVEEALADVKTHNKRRFIMIEVTP